MSATTTQTISISSTFDVARARNYLRKIADDNDWSTVFRARAAAVVTTLAEMALFKGHSRAQSLVLNVGLIQQQGHTGLEFYCEIPLISDDPSYYNISQSQLERTADEMNIEIQDSVAFIAVRVWAD